MSSWKEVSSGLTQGSGGDPVRMDTCTDNLRKLLETVSIKCTREKTEEIQYVSYKYLTGFKGKELNS